MSEDTKTTDENNQNDQNVSEEETNKIINAVAGDIIKTTNLFQAFELVKERAFDWAKNHVSTKMPLEEKMEILNKISEVESEAQQNNSNVANPEEGAALVNEG